jgi:hypothetical protein
VWDKVDKLSWRETPTPLEMWWGKGVALDTPFEGAPLDTLDTWGIPFEGDTLDTWGTLGI